MTILPSDIKLLESERMADTTDGGGRRTSREIPDGVAGNIFPKVSRLDSVYGRVNLRKVYGFVDTPNLDVYAGCHMVVTDSPNNEKINVTVFSTGSDVDERSAARDRIESYVVAGPESSMILYGRQLSGQQTLLAYQREGDTAPEVGDVYAISNESGGVITTQQYVRITDVSVASATFTDDKGDFKRDLVTLKIGAPLRYEFNGPETPSRFSAVAKPSRIRTTSVADASRYYGITKLSAETLADDLDVDLESIYTVIVPTTLRETPIALAEISGANALRPIGAQIVGEVLGVMGIIVPTGTRSISLARGIMPGSLSLAIEGGGSATDNGDGTMTGTSTGGIHLDETLIDYEAGTITVSAITGGTNAVTLSATYIPAAAVGQPVHTREVQITIATRGTVYSEVLNPLPAPGSVIVDYRALGKWYRLRDDGAGELAGLDPAFGVGSVNYTTGALVVTLGALPDVGSAILLSWGSPAHYIIRAGATSDADAAVEQVFTLTNLPVKPGSLTVTWHSGGTTYTATDAAGVIAGTNLTGVVDYTSGEVRLRYTTVLPDADANVTVDYEDVGPATPGTDPVPIKAYPTNVGSTIALGESITPGSLKFSLIATGTLYGAHYRASVAVVDQGDAVLRVLAGTVLLREESFWNYGAAGQVIADQVVGTINYSTGLISLSSPTFTGNITGYNYAV